MKIKIISDSTCDLSQEILEKYDITLVPLTIVKDGQAYADGGGDALGQNGNGQIPVKAQDHAENQKHGKAA